MTVNEVRMCRLVVAGLWTKGVNRNQTGACAVSRSCGGGGENWYWDMRTLGCCSLHYCCNYIRTPLTRLLFTGLLLIHAHTIHWSHCLLLLPLYMQTPLTTNTVWELLLQRLQLYMWTPLTGLPTTITTSDPDKTKPPGVKMGNVLLFKRFPF